jgi:hypothetical protein
MRVYARFYDLGPPMSICDARRCATLDTPLASLYRRVNVYLQVITVIESAYVSLPFINNDRRRKEQKKQNIRIVLYQ